MQSLQSEGTPRQNLASQFDSGKVLAKLSVAEHSITQEFERIGTLDLPVILNADEDAKESD